jgi:NAD(P)-dependent dehydrogenase (short-subunit alcohol dehydrogenase family)
VVAAARRGDLLDALAAELPGTVPVVADVTTEQGRKAMTDAALGAFGRIDVLVNNAGQGLHLPLAEVDPGDLRAILDLNVVAPLAVIQQVLPIMRAQGGGAIVNVSSGTTRRVLPGVGAYAASKAALNMLSDVARAEFAGDGIVVSTVYPTLTATEFHDNLRAGGLRTDLPLRPDSAENVAEAICELIVSGEPEYVLAPRVPGDGR